MYKHARVCWWVARHSLEMYNPIPSYIFDVLYETYKRSLQEEGKHKHTKQIWIIRSSFFDHCLCNIRFMYMLPGLCIPMYHQTTIYLHILY